MMSRVRKGLSGSRQIGRAMDMGNSGSIKDAGSIEDSDVGTHFVRVTTCRAFHSKPKMSGSGMASALTDRWGRRIRRSERATTLVNAPGESTDRTGITPIRQGQSLTPPFITPFRFENGEIQHMSRWSLIDTSEYQARHASAITSSHIETYQRRITRWNGLRR